MDLKEQILVALGLNKSEEVVMAWQGKSDDGTLFVSTAEELEEGVDFSVLTEDGTTILAPIGTYRLESGVSVRISEEGIVAEVIQSETETEEVVEEELAEEEDKKDYEEEADVADWKGMEKRIQNLEDAVADLKRDKDGGDDEVEEMAEVTEEPSSNPKTITTKEVVEFSAEDELANLKAENEKLKIELAESPASAPLDTNKFSSDVKTISKKEYNKLSRREKFLHDLNK